MLTQVSCIEAISDYPGGERPSQQTLGRKQRRAVTATTTIKILCHQNLIYCIREHNLSVYTNYRHLSFVVGLTFTRLCNMHVRSLPLYHARANPLQAWGRAVLHDATFIIFNCGVYERIGVHHRASQTLCIFLP